MNKVGSHGERISNGETVTAPRHQSNRPATNGAFSIKVSRFYDCPRARFSLLSPTLCEKTPQ